MKNPYWQISLNLNAKHMPFSFINRRISNDFNIKSPVKAVISSFFDACSAHRQQSYSLLGEKRQQQMVISHIFVPMSVINFIKAQFYHFCNMNKAPYKVFGIK